MISHPDADAFVQAIVRDPADVTTRLVFADWLEETGEPSNVAWARFIRLMVEADRHPSESEERKALEKSASDLSAEVRGKLTLDAAQLVGQAEHVRRLLPTPNIVLRLAGYELLRELMEFIPESVAREDVVAPLHHRGNRLLIASADPTNLDTIQKLQFILNKDIVLVPADADAIRAVIDHYYGQTETECISSIHYEAPLVGLEPSAESFEIARVFLTAFSQHEFGRRCNGFEIGQTEAASHITYFDGTRTILQDSYSPGVFVRLLVHFLSLPVDEDYLSNGMRCLDFDIPLLSGRRFPATLERRAAEPECTWFRLRFRWEDRD